MTREQWQREYEAGGTRDVDYETMSGVPVEPLYGPVDAEPDDRIGWPGQYPYTRGVHPSGYRGRLWTMRMFAGFGTPEDTNERFKEILSAGGGGLSTAFDMPTLMGLDSDDVLSVGEVGPNWSVPIPWLVPGLQGVGSGLCISDVRRGGLGVPLK